MVSLSTVSHVLSITISVSYIQFSNWANGYRIIGNVNILIDCRQTLNPYFRQLASNYRLILYTYWGNHTLGFWPRNEHLWTDYIYIFHLLYWLNDGRIWTECWPILCELLASCWCQSISAVSLNFVSGHTSWPIYQTTIDRILTNYRQSQLIVNQLLANCGPIYRLTIDRVSTDHLSTDCQPIYCGIYICQK